MNALTALIERVPKQPGGSICLTCKVIQWITLYPIKWEGLGPTARAGRAGLCCLSTRLHAGHAMAVMYSAQWGDYSRAEQTSKSTSTADWCGQTKQGWQHRQQATSPTLHSPPPQLCVHITATAVCSRRYSWLPQQITSRSPLQVLSWPIQSKQQDLIVF